MFVRRKGCSTCAEQAFTPVRHISIGNNRNYNFGNLKCKIKPVKKVREEASSYRDGRISQSIPGSPADAPMNSARETEGLLWCAGLRDPNHSTLSMGNQPAEEVVFP